jgi:hypothetical protein
MQNRTVAFTEPLACGLPRGASSLAVLLGVRSTTRHISLSVGRIPPRAARCGAGAIAGSGCSTRLFEEPTLLALPDWRIMGEQENQFSADW